MSKEKEVAKILIKNNLKIMSSESCTGGLLSSRLTDISGSSSYIYKNFITYANEAKEELLDINHSLIEEKGVVSSEVALEMVQGMLKKFDCDIAISTTGIAGPLGGSSEKPVGLVYIGIGNKDCQKSYKYMVSQYLNRRLMKYAFSNKALELLLQFLKENYKI